MQSDCPPPLNIISSLVARLLRTAREGQPAEVKMPPDEEMRLPSAVPEVGSVERGQSVMERARVCFSCGRPGHGVNRWMSRMASIGRHGLLELGRGLLQEKRDGPGGRLNLPDHWGQGTTDPGGGECRSGRGQPVWQLPVGRGPGPSWASSTHAFQPLESHPAEIQGQDNRKKFSAVAEAYSSAVDDEGAPLVIRASKQRHAVVGVGPVWPSEKCGRPVDFVTVPEPIEHSVVGVPNEVGSSFVDSVAVPEPIVSAVSVALAELAPPGEMCETLPVHLEDIVTGSHPSLGEGGRLLLRNLLHRYEHVFPAPAEPVTGHTTSVQHEILTSDTRPVRCEPRRLAPGRSPYRTDMC